MFAADAIRCMRRSNVTPPAGDDFVLNIDTALKTGLSDTRLRFQGPLDLTIDWGDGIVEAVTAGAGQYPYYHHLYAAHGQYTIRVTGTCKSFAQDGTYNYRSPWIACESFGNITTDLGGVFYECRNLISVPEQLPVGATSLRYAMYRCYALNDPSVSMWDVSSVTNMLASFQNASVFDQDLSGWCVSNIATEPADFSVGSALQEIHKPIWGTCP